MEAKDKIKKLDQKTKPKFSFGNMKIRNKIIFGFFIVSIISGLANYYSNLFIVNEFRAVNSTMHKFHNIFTLQKKLELMLENYIESETKTKITETEFRTLRMDIEREFNDFMHSGGSFLDKDMMEKYVNESGHYFETENDVFEIHTEEIESRTNMMELLAQEKKMRYEIRSLIEKLNDKDIYLEMINSEYMSKEAMYQYKDSEHREKWIEALEKLKATAESKSTEIPGMDEYIVIASEASMSVVEHEALEQKQNGKMVDFRFAMDKVTIIQDDVSRALTDRNINDINTIVLIGVFVFISILIIVNILFGYVISSFIARPIKELANFALLASGGDFKRRIRVNSTDEIGQMSHVFNMLLDKVEESTMVLEVKVQARTKRLQELSSNLEVQINNKTKELNEKIAELERFNDLAVGRELRMIELKRENEILKQGGIVRKKKGTDPAADKEAKMNCWDYWKCSKPVRDNCLAYRKNSGRQCWLVSAGKCPRSKERGFEDCKDCGWYKKMNNIY